MNIAHITQRLAGCHGTGCATHQGKDCDCGVAPMANTTEAPLQEHDIVADLEIDVKGTAP